MIRKINRVFQDFMREKRLKIGKWYWDKKSNKEKIEEGEFLKVNGIKSILFLRYDGKIGDMVVNTLMFREIKKNYPDIKIGVVTREGAAQLLKNNPYVDDIYIYIKKTSEIKKLAQKISMERYDLLIDFSEMLRVNQMMFINRCQARYNMGLNRESWKLFDISYSLPEGDYHITAVYKKVLEILGIKDIDLSYDLHFNMEDIKKVEEKIIPFKDKEIYVVNPFAASKHRELNSENICKIIDIILKSPKRVVFLIGEKGKKKEILNIVEKYSKNVVYPELDSILETAYLIKKSNFVITPDTSIVHIAACFKKPMIAIYRIDSSDSNQVNKNLWAPNYKEATQIFSKDLDVKVGEEPDINKFKMEEIEKIINKI